MIPSEHLLVEVVYRHTGTTARPGGQHAGTPPSSVRVTHLPTGIIAQCGAARSQHRNRLVCEAMLEEALTGTNAKHLDML